MVRLAPVTPVIKLLAGKALSLSLFFSRRYRMDYHFTGLFQEIHRPVKYSKALRLQVAVKLLPGIPFFKKAEFIFILHALVKVAAPASPLFP